jgi:hypothetical protein
MKYFLNRHGLNDTIDKSLFTIIKIITFSCFKKKNFELTDGKNGSAFIVILSLKDDENLSLGVSILVFVSSLEGKSRHRKKTK